MQTLEYITNKKYGRGLEIANIDLTSFIASAQLCDSRSDIIIKVEDASGVVVGDTYTLDTVGNGTGTHVASGVVTSTVNNSIGYDTITLTQVINKFAKQWTAHTNFVVGDIVHTITGKYYRAAAIALPAAEEPIHTSGTTDSLAYLGDYTDAIGASPIVLNRTLGTGSTTLNMYKGAGNPIEYALYDSDWIKYWRYYGWEHHHQREVTRHQCNFILDSAKSVFANTNAMLSHFNGILTYENGKYVLDVETQEVTPTASLNSNQENINPFYIDNTDVIGKITIKDASQKGAKNTIKASIADPQNNWGSRSVTFFNSDFLKADRNVVKTGSFPFSGITNYYNARINVEKELYQTRYGKEISFTLGPRAILLRAGEVISITYPAFGWSSKLFRIENLSFASNCNVSVKAREYDDSIYEISRQQAATIITGGSQQTSLAVPKTPSALVLTQNLSGSHKLTWTNATDYNETSDSTEIWTSSSNSRTAATLLAVVDNAEEYIYTPAVALTSYYWIRHRRVSTMLSGNGVTTVHSPW